MLFTVVKRSNRYAKEKDVITNKSTPASGAAKLARPLSPIALSILRRNADAARLRSYVSNQTYGQSRPVLGMILAQREFGLHGENTHMRATERSLILPIWEHFDAPEELAHIDSSSCWCEPIVERDDFACVAVIHREVTWN